MNILFLVDSSNTSANISSGSGSSFITDSNFWSDFWNKIVNFFKVDMVNFSFRLVLALILLVAGIYIIKLICFLLRKWLTRARDYTNKKNKKSNHKEMDPSIVTFTVSTIRFILAIVLAVSFIATLGLALDGIVSILSSAFLAIGIGLQDVITNFADGVILISEGNIKTGDYIIVDGLEGTVKKISMMRTTLTTVDGKTVLLPNSALSSDNVINCSTEEYRRIVLYYSFPYGTDIEKMSKLILEVVNSLEMTCKDDAHKAFMTVDDFSQSRVDVIKLRVAFYCHNKDYWDLLSLAQKAMYERFVKENIKGAEFKNEIYLPLNK